MQGMGIKILLLKLRIVYTVSYLAQKHLIH